MKLHVTPGIAVCDLMTVVTRKAVISGMNISVNSYITHICTLSLAKRVKKEVIMSCKPTHHRMSPQDNQTCHKQKI